MATDETALCSHECSRRVVSQLAADGEDRRDGSSVTIALPKEAGQPSAPLEAETERGLDVQAIAAPFPRLVADRPWSAPASEPWVGCRAPSDRQRASSRPSVLDGRHILAARLLLGWSQTALASSSGLSLAVVQKVEREAVEARSSAIFRMQIALERANVQFIRDQKARLLGIYVPICS
jgi:hypothetical protein